MAVQDYLVSAESCHSIKPTECKGRYLLITTYQQLTEASNWLDKNLKQLFVKYCPNYSTFTPINGYEYPKRGNKL